MYRAAKVLEWQQCSRIKRKQKDEKWKLKVTSGSQRERALQVFVAKVQGRKTKAERTVVVVQYCVRTKTVSRPPTLCCSICLSRVSKAALSPPVAPLGRGPRGRFCTRPGWAGNYIQIYANMKVLSHIFQNLE